MEARLECIARMGSGCRPLGGEVLLYSDKKQHRGWRELGLRKSFFKKEKDGK